MTQKRNKKTKKFTGKKKVWKVKNWSAYNNTLVQRGSLDIWVQKDIAEQWYEKDSLGKNGAPFVYTDLAITVARTLGKVFHQKLRQTEGFVNSIFHMLGASLQSPDYTTLCRRGKTLNVDLGVTVHSNEPRTIIIDSTGLKVYGEGEWKVRKHGYSKRRTWMKLHIGIDQDGEIRMEVLTDNTVVDADVFEDLLSQETEEIDETDADGAYDKRKAYAVLMKRKVPKINIPPQINAKIWQHGNCKKEPHPRDENLRAIRKSTRKKWKQNSGYHIRSRVETTMYRIKTVFGGHLQSRLPESQKVEARLMCRALNVMTRLGMPECYVTEVSG